MQKVTERLKQFCCLSSVHEKRFKSDVILKRCIDADKQIEHKIIELENRLVELKELQKFMGTNNQIYLFRDDCSRFCYANKAGEIYEYKESHGKHILIDKNFNVYEIIEYETVKDVVYEKNLEVQIDKVVKVKPLTRI